MSTKRNYLLILFKYILSPIKIHAAISGCSLLLVTNLVFSNNLPVNDFPDGDLGVDTESISLATGQKQPVASSPVVATIITKEEIESQGYRNVEEALVNVPGFHVSPTSIIGINAVSVRGYTSGFTLLYLVDGKPYTASVYGSKAMDVRRMPMGLIERIEILRGPGSSIYSTDAFMGVVNIITKNKMEKTTARISGGSFDTYEATITGGGKLGRVDAVYGVNLFSTKGHEPFVPADAASGIDFQLGTDTSLAPGTGNTDNNTVSVEANLHNGDYLLSLNAGKITDKGMYVGFLPILDKTGTMDLLNLGTFYEFPIEDNYITKVIGSVGFDYRKWDLNDVNYYPAGSFGVFPDGVVGSIGHQETNFTARITGSFLGYKGHQLTYSVQARSERVEVTEYESNFAISPESPIGLVPVPIGTFDVTGNNEHREILSLKVNDEFILTSSLTANIGFSADYSTLHDSFLLPRGALNWNVSSTTSIKFLVGQGVRYPSFIESLDIGTPAILPNPDLKSELLTSYDIVLDTRLSKRVSFKGNIFYHVTKNPVTLGASVDDPRLTPLNLVEQKGQGLEFDTVFDASENFSIGLFGHYQKNEGDYRVGNPDIKDIGFAPHLKLGVKTDYRWNDIQFGAAYTYIGDRDRRPATENKPEPDRYSKLNVNVLYEPNDNLKIGLKVENIFDDDSLEMTIGDLPWDNELPGRAAYLSLSATW